MSELPYAETVNYWKTSQSAPDQWLQKAKRLITDLGGTVLSEVFGSDGNTGRSAYMLQFEINGDRFRITWPVLPTKKPDDELAAKRQACTLIYHEVKARVLHASVLGTRSAFFQYLMLQDGRTAQQASLPELEHGLPGILQIT